MFNWILEYPRNSLEYKFVWYYSPIVELFYHYLSKSIVWKASYWASIGVLEHLLDYCEVLMSFYAKRRYGSNVSSLIGGVTPWQSEWCFKPHTGCFSLAIRDLLPGSPWVSTIPPKNYGCVCFVHAPKHPRGKKDLKAFKCKFIGYYATQKG